MRTGFFTAMETGRRGLKTGFPNSMLIALGLHGRSCYRVPFSSVDGSELPPAGQDWRATTRQATTSPDTDCSRKTPGSDTDTVPAESSVDTENTTGGERGQGSSVSDDNKLLCPKADRSENTTCGIEQMDLDVIRPKKGSLKEHAGDEMKPSKCETGKAVPDSGTRMSGKALTDDLRARYALLKCVFTWLVATECKAMPQIHWPALDSVCKRKANIFGFVASADKMVAVASWPHLASVFKTIAVTSSFAVTSVCKTVAYISWPVASVCKTMVSVSWPVLASVCKTVAGISCPLVSVCKKSIGLAWLIAACVCKKLADNSVVSSVCKKLADNSVVSSVCKKLADVSVVAVVCKRSANISFVCKGISVFALLAIAMMWRGLTARSKRNKMGKSKTRGVCVAGWTAKVFLVVGLICSLHTTSAATRLPPRQPLSEQFIPLLGNTIPGPYPSSGFKSECNGVGQEMFCLGTNGDDNLCTCREGFQPSCDGTFTDNSACFCEEMVCPPGSAPSRSSVEADCKNLSDGQYPQFTCTPVTSSTPPPSGHPASLTTGTPPMTTPDSHDTPAVGKTGEGSLGGSGIAFVCAMIVVLLAVFIVVYGNTVKDKVCGAWYRMRGDCEPNLV